MAISRQDIYSYITTIFSSVTKNIYPIEIPSTLSSDAVKNGFIVLKLNEIKDQSEFLSDTYSDPRMYVESYIPSKADGSINKTKYEEIQSTIDSIVLEECKKTNQVYTISKESILSGDDFYTNKTNSFFMYIASFTITI